MPSETLGVLRRADQPVRRWRNGGGDTREIATRLLGGVGPDFVWRISIAEVVEQGEFSHFPGVDRIMTLIDGDTMALEIDGVEHTLTLDQPITFSGDSRCVGTHLSRPSRALNVMTRRNRMSASVKFRELSERPISIAGATAIVLLRGQATIFGADGSQAELNALDAVVPRPGVRVVTGEGTAAVVRLENYRMQPFAG